MNYKNGLSYIQKKSSRAFVISLLVSLFVWGLINLSKTYEKTITVHVLYKNLEEGTFVKSIDSTLTIKVKGSGFTLINNKLKSLNYTIDTKKGINEWVWEANGYQFNELFSKNIKVLSVIPKRIKFKIKTLAKKKVPIQSKIIVKTKLGYGVISSSLSKDSIMIYGDKLNIDSISEIRTDSLFFDTVFEKLEGEVSLKNENENVQIEIQKVKYSYDIERFTQGDFQVNIEIKNMPKEKKLTIFPKQVNVQFQSPLSLFSDYRAESFGVFVDFNEISASNALPIHIEYIPKGVRNVKVLKKSVTYIVIAE